MRNILPFLQEGHEYSQACALAGYRHSKNSLTQEEKENKVYKEYLDILPKNSLRNPVVEKILNQMVHVINSIIEIHGKPDEIRIELARELKKNAKQREEMTKSINQATTAHDAIRKLLPLPPFNLTHISKNDIIRYKLYEELKVNGYHTLYSNTYISPNKLFSKEFDVEHIIPKSRLFDDSFSNKTLEQRDINIEKGNETAYDFVAQKYGEQGLQLYQQRLDGLYKDGVLSKAKYTKLCLKRLDIPEGFIERDLNNTQYIAKKAKDMLGDLVKNVVATTGSITDRLRSDWQLIDVMQELNWDKYHLQGLTEVIENRDGYKIKRIIDWTKRNDHRHHAMDALTVAFTKEVYVQYLNNMNAKSDKGGAIYGIEKTYLERDAKSKLRFKSPIPLSEFRIEARKHLEKVLISIKAKNKVVTININKTKTKSGFNQKKQLTPRGQLHNETIYGSMQRYGSKYEKTGASFDQEQIHKVTNPRFREALLARLAAYGNDPKLAFTGKNSPSKNPIYIDHLQTDSLPEKVKLVWLETVYTIRKEISPDLKLDKVVDVGIRKILEARLLEYGNNAQKAFSNLGENPIWLNQDKGISIKRVTITGISNAESLHTKRNKEGKPILDKEGKTQAVDFVSTSNNHHVAIYQDAKGVLQEKVVSFFEATIRANQALPIVDKEYNKGDGWQFLFTMKQNEYFVFPNPKAGFNPHDVDLMNPDNYADISPNLFRVQKFTIRDYVFRHHLETSVDSNNELKDITWKRLGLAGIGNIVKVRLNHLGQIVEVGEY
ncbi:MAG: type RNA-guided endonuclease Cas9 [Bacteroidota bacterium]|jgi:CRISPR-associated endonuclease Csn1